MTTKQKETLQKAGLTLIVLLIIAAALVLHYTSDPWGFYRKVSDAEAALRMQVVITAQSHLGAKESDGSHRAIVDIYNAHEPLAIGYEVQYTDSWCAAFVSAVAIQTGITDIIPTECGCERQIGLFQQLERWQEDEAYIPLPGDLIYYDWDQTKPGDCTGWSDHVGLVVGTAWPFIKVIEGNKDDSVSYRYVFMGDVRIRGFAAPDYAAMTENDP